MMKTKRILTLAAVAAMMAACSNDVPAPAAVDHMSDTPIGFKPGISAMTTRAGYAAGELTAGELGFCMQTAGTDGLDATTAAKYNGSNRKVKCTNGKWAVEGYPLLWRNQSDEVTWKAYYPYADDNTVTDGIIPVTVPTAQSEGVYDLLYGSGSTTGATSAAISIDLKHQMSKLIVKLNTGTELGTLEYESVVIAGMNTKWSFNLQKGIWNIDGDIGTPGNINMIKHEDGLTFEAIILPLNPDQLNIDITTADGRKFYYKRGNPHFKEGQVHTLNLTVGKDKVEAARVEATDWAPQSGTGETE